MTRAQLRVGLARSVVLGWAAWWLYTGVTFERGPRWELIVGGAVLLLWHALTMPKKPPTPTLNTAYDQLKAYAEQCERELAELSQGKVTPITTKKKRPGGRGKRGR